MSRCTFLIFRFLVLYIHRNERLLIRYSFRFFPNDNIPDLAQYTTDYLVHEQDYHLFPNELRYSPDLSDGLILQSNQGGNATIRVVKGSTYVNAAKIVSTDYLTYNGVMHILDR
jgi:uncharacterized surface protein with fasciclin (FAS1) repeats